MTRAVGRSLALVLTVGLAAPCALAAPPPVARLFGCPLAAAPAGFEPLPTWGRHRLPGLGVSIALPPGWTLDATGAAALARAPDGAYRIALRHGRLVGARRLDFVRRSVELTELGPSYVGRRCEDRIDRALRAVAGWSRVEVGVYGRPLGGRRRSFALYVGLPDGSVLTAVVTAYWSHRSEPDLALVRRLIGGIAALRPSAGAASERSAR